MLSVVDGGPSDVPDGSPPRERLPDRDPSTPAQHRALKQSRVQHQYMGMLVDGVFMACTALAIMRAIRDGHDPLRPCLDFAQEHMNWLRVHIAHRYCTATPPLAIT